MADCACLAGIVALKHFRRPDVEVTGDEVTIVRLSPSLSLILLTSQPQHAPSERAPVPVSIRHTPFTFTFAFSSDPAIPPILDPTYLEQRLSAGQMTIALNAQREMCVLQKAGGVPLASDEILRLVDVAVDRAKELDKLVETRLREDWESRNVEVQ